MTNKEEAANVLRIMASGIELKGYSELCISSFKESYEMAIKALEEPERPQSEPVIKCQDCKYQVKVWREDKRMKEKGYWDYGCEHMGDIMGFWGFGGYDDEFCSDAEQRGGAE